MGKFWKKTLYAAEMPEAGAVYLYETQEEAASKVPLHSKIFPVFVATTLGVGTGVRYFDIEFSRRCCEGDSWEISSDFDADGKEIYLHAFSMEDGYHYGTFMCMNDIRADTAVEAMEKAIEAAMSLRDGSYDGRNHEDDYQNKVRDMEFREIEKEEFAAGRKAAEEWDANNPL